MNRAERRRQQKLAKKTGGSQTNAAQAQNALQQAVDSHQSGRFDEAIRWYRQTLALQPNNAAALCNMGLALSSQSKMTEAIASYRQAIAIQPAFPEAYINLGIALKEQGDLAGAIDSYRAAIAIRGDIPEAHKNLGNALVERNRLEEAVASYAQAAALKPDDAELHANIGKALIGLGKREEAIASLRRAASITPEDAETHFLLGGALKREGKLDDAVHSLRQATRHRPDWAEALINLGNALTEQGALEEAASSLRRAITLAPGLPEAHINLGNALKEQRDLDGAASSYRQALSLRPDDPDARFNLATAVKESGRPEEALTDYRQAVALAPDNSLYWSGFAQCVNGMNFTAWDEERAESLLRLLEQPTLRPNDVAGAAINALRCHPEMLGAFDALQSDRIAENLHRLTERFSALPLLLRVMRVSFIADAPMENLLTRMRRAMLEKAVTGDDDARGLPFYVALALHSFTNEYAFFESEDETREAALLDQEIEAALADGSTVSPYRIAILAAYKPLYATSWAERLQEVDGQEGIVEIIVQQLDNVREEQALRDRIATLSPIEDAVSRAVRGQYEENPYPRWINTGLNNRPKTILQALGEGRIHPDAACWGSSPEPKILVAGCGTGQHALAAATRFANSSVLAVDLSLSSLSYATRKSRELGVVNIDFMQGDILALGRLERRFDLIECGGVLHHMDDPMAGWRVLTEILRPGGVMKIGLYSDIARQAVVEARAFIARENYPSTPEGIRRFRRDVIDGAGGLPEAIANILVSRDFYSLSECRDLLFHVQEHRFTLPQIEAALQELGLTFLGFELDKNQVRTAFSDRHPGKEAWVSLPLWHEFERHNPGTFAGMYQFWAQK